MSNSSVFSKVTSGSVLTATCILGLLYFGREVLEPLALALVLSLVIAPLIRAITRTGLGQLPATLISVLLSGVAIVGVCVMLASQLVAVSADLPQYRDAIQAKLQNIREITERPFARIEAELRAVAPASPISGPPARRQGSNLVLGQSKPIPVEIHTPELSTTETITRLLSLISGPIGTAGLVLVLLVFILLEHESLRDRVVRLAGKGEVGRTMRALGDATEGVSRFFFSQFLVNVIFGAVVGAALWSADIPHAALFGVLSGLLRFVPYLGALVAGAAIALFVAAIDPGWTLALACLVTFGVLELIVANVVEPKVYGQSSGLSPLAVIVSALFWGAMWGPVGLLLSTPLTLCLVVAGRHVRALEPITILFSDTPSTNEAQRFYHRIMSGDAEAIIRDAQTYLRKFSFARYCDQILLPGLALGTDEYEAGRIETTQQNQARATIAALAESLVPKSDRPLQHRGRRRISMLDANVGAHLRQMRQLHLGRWQGSLDVPARSIALCAGLPNERDDLLNELFVLTLREVGVDARSVSVAQPDDGPGPGPGREDLVSTVFLTYPLKDTLARWQVVAGQLRASLPQALLVTIRLSPDSRDANQSVVEQSVDMVLRTFEEGVALLASDSPARP
ncbi:MAG: AI-2E family transporter [Pseudomonadota bacterium]|nr:AI-2E family transporter [Pseudomonadota bacterium]